MTRIIFLLLILYTCAYGFEGPDFMLIGRHYIADDGRSNMCADDKDDGGLTISLENASLYDIKSLDWLYAGAGYSYHNWTVCGSFRGYGIDNLYESTAYGITLHRLFIEHLSLGAGISHQEVTYGDNLYKHSATDLLFDLGVRLADVNFDAIISNIALADYDAIINGDPEAIISGNWIANDALKIYAAFYKDCRDHVRFIVGQDLLLTKSLIINAGLLSSPEIYYFGVEIVYKRFQFSYTLYDISGLPNCSKVALSIR